MLLLNTPIINIGDILGITDQGFRTLFRIAVASRVKQEAHMWINAFRELCFSLTNHSPGLVHSELRLGWPHFTKLLGTRRAKEEVSEGTLLCQEIVVPQFCIDKLQMFQCMPAHSSLLCLFAFPPFFFQGLV